MSTHCSYLPFFNDLREALGEAGVVEIVQHSPYPEYMRLMEEGDFALDSFHFGGCNTIADSLFLGKPPIVWEGQKWYNRVGPCMLRLAGLDELICTTEEEYLEKALRMIHDDRHREDLAAKVRRPTLTARCSARPTPPRFFGPSST